MGPRLTESLGAFTAHPSSSSTENCPGPSYPGLLGHPAGDYEETRWRLDVEGMPFLGKTQQGCFLKPLGPSSLGPSSG